MQEPEVPTLQPSRWPRWIRAFAGGWSPRDLLLLAICPLIGVGAAYASERFQSRDHVLQGVELDGEDVSGYARSVLELRAQEQQRALSFQRLRVRVGKAVFRLSGADVGAKRNDDVLEQVMTAGRRGNVLGQVFWRARRASSFESYMLQRSLWTKHSSRNNCAPSGVAALPIPTEGKVSYSEGKVVATYPAAGKPSTAELRPSCCVLLSKGVTGAWNCRASGGHQPPRVALSTRPNTSSKPRCADRSSMFVRVLPKATRHKPPTKRAKPSTKKTMNSASSW